jgi:N-acyl-D-aspartate/D-glutamate deacylase
MSNVAPTFAPPLDRVFALGDPPEYEPAPEDSIAARAQRAGISPVELLYDLLLEREGKEMLYFPAGNYHAFNLDAARDMLSSDRALFGLSDGGAHVGTISDGSFPTYNIIHWGRDRKRGDQLPLELVVKRQTSDTAHHVGLRDRGVVAPGYKADLNVIDFDALRLEAPEVVHDLPAGGRRLLQKATGYRYTIASGQVSFEDGQHTGVLPGNVIRGAQSPAL